ncbi:MAG: GNAT family N-acetyltransferase [Acidimicrobiia bacterium]
MSERVAPLELLRAVLDPLRLSVLAESTHGPISLTEISERLDIPNQDVARAVGDLRSAGLLCADGTINRGALVEIGRSLPQEHPDLGTPLEGPWTENEARILGRFFSGGRLVEIPSSARKRRLVLERIAQEFEPGERYAERDVNFKIQLVHGDYAAIRRYMVEEGFMDRADGTYWRTGGRYEAPEVAESGHGEQTGRLATEREDVVLRPYRWSMIDALIAVADDERIPVYMGDQFATPYTTEAAEEWLEIATSSDPPLQYAIYVSDEFAGGLGAVLLNAENTGVAEIGWWLGPEHWGRGIATAAAKALIDEMFDNRGLMRLWAPVMRPNKGSARVAEKAGMVLEGVAPSQYVKHGVRYDQLNYGITRDQWESRQ